MHEVGKSPHVQSPKQALAIAYAIKGRGRANGGVAGYAYGGTPGFGGNPLTNWQERQEARNMHTGPILSSVAGRTDHLPMSVPSGAYVLPASHVSSMGQGNTMAGFSALGKMFGNAGPYGVGRNMPIGHGMGAPRAPALPKFGLGGHTDKGGARGDGAGQPVDIVAAGGEFVISPEIVRRIGRGDLKKGHAILDHWVMKSRKKEIKVQRALPPPAKR